jgi:heat-inducible transcriptional repressor
MLSERQKLILHAIIDDYIKQAEPIGSRSISKREEIKFSPATIRNEMADLEELGFLDQPHTSAGRVPSIKGYRYYVDHLIRLGEIPQEMRERIRAFFEGKIAQTEDVMQHAATILSNLTHYTAVVLGPAMRANQLKHFDLIHVNKNTAVAIIVTNTGHVEHRMVTIPEGMDQGEIQRAVNMLNDKLNGEPLSTMKRRITEVLSQVLRNNAEQLRAMLSIFDQALEPEQEDGRDVFRAGMTNMLIQPEFQDASKVKDLIDWFEKMSDWSELLTQMPRGLVVRIGTENMYEVMNDLSLITASYSLDGKQLGTIGIIGPTRMNYAKVMTFLDVISKDMSLGMRQWFK